MDNVERIGIAKRAVRAALQNVFPHLEDKPIRMEVVGSTYISERTDSDVDVLVCVPFVVDTAHFPGWVSGGSASDSGNGNFQSWKRVEDGVLVNLLGCSSMEYINSWLTAAEVCRFLHIRGIPLDTGAVHGVHEIVMDDSTAVVEQIRRDYA